MTEAHAPANSNTNGSTAALLEISNLTVEFKQGRSETYRAVDGVSLSVSSNEIVAVVGESGAGKSTLCRAVLGLAPVSSGTIKFNGNDITNASHSERVKLASSLQVVFQDPNSSLNPSRMVRSSLAEPLLHKGLTRSEMHSRVVEMLGRVGLDEDAADKYPRQFSGGQRQRIAIARALMPSPQLIVCDEALSGLDLSIQAQIINLLIEIRREFHLALLFIGHDLNVVRHLAQRIFVLRNGAVVESGPTEQLFSNPKEKYTKELIAAVPELQPKVERARLDAMIAGDSADLSANASDVSRNGKSSDQKS